LKELIEDMQTSEQIRNSVAELYWLVFLLTGQRGLSQILTQDVLSSPGCPGASSRRTAVTKAFAAVRRELALSVVRLGSKKFEMTGIPPRTWSLDPDTTKVQLENALLAIDIFPRWALLLTVFERLGLEEASTLLDADRELVQQGRVAGLLDLTRNLARASFDLNENHLATQSVAV
jgi:hypothetical protein